MIRQTLSTLLFLLLCVLQNSVLAQSQASVKFQGFRWQASGRFFVTAETWQGPAEIKGELQDGQQTRVDEEAVTVEVAAFKEGFVVVLLTELGSDSSDISILERQNGRYNKVHNTVIQGNAGSALSDLMGALAALKQANGWDASLSFRAIVGYFASRPGQKTIKDFYDAVELGHIKSVPKPADRGQLPVQRERPGQFDVRPQDQPPQGFDPRYDSYGQGSGYYGQEYQEPRPRRQRQQQPRRQRPPPPQMPPPWGGGFGYGPYWPPF